MCIGVELVTVSELDEAIHVISLDDALLSQADVEHPREQPVSGADSTSDIRLFLGKGFLGKLKRTKGKLLVLLRSNLR